MMRTFLLTPDGSFVGSFGFFGGISIGGFAMHPIIKHISNKLMYFSILLFLLFYI